MTKQREIINFNHISSKLTSNQVDELKSYYRTYHRKATSYKMAVKQYKRMKLICNMSSILFASSGIFSAIFTSAISLVAISSVSLLIQSWMNHVSLDHKISICTYAYQSYDHVLNTIMSILRTGNYNSDSLHTILANIDDNITNISPIITKFFEKYDRKFRKN